MSDAHRPVGGDHGPSSSRIADPVHGDERHEPDEDEAERAGERARSGCREPDEREEPDCGADQHDRVARPRSRWGVRRRPGRQASGVAHTPHDARIRSPPPARTRPATIERRGDVHQQRHPEQHGARSHQRRQAERRRTSPKRSAIVRRRSSSPPDCRMCGVERLQRAEMIATAIVSPSARPSPSIEPPMMPPAPERQHDGADHAPARPAQRQRALLLGRRRLREHLAHDRGRDRDHHQRDDQTPATNGEDENEGLRSLEHAG